MRLNCSQKIRGMAIFTTISGQFPHVYFCMRLFLVDFPNFRFMKWLVEKNGKGEIPMMQSSEDGFEA